jgi:hypothetical protein
MNSLCRATLKITFGTSSASTAPQNRINAIIFPQKRPHFLHNVIAVTIHTDVSLGAAMIWRVNF